MHDILVTVVIRNGTDDQSWLSKGGAGVPVWTPILNEERNRETGTLLNLHSGVRLRLKANRGGSSLRCVPGA